MPSLKGQRSETRLLIFVAGVLVGRVAHGHRGSHLYGDLHPVLRHPHAVVESQSSQEPPLLGDAEEASQIFTTKGTGSV